jgi:hypothetical protein
MMTKFSPLYLFPNSTYDESPFLMNSDTVSHVGIFDPSCELLPLYLLSDLPHPLPKVNVQYLQTVWLGGGGVKLCCRPYFAGVKLCF